MGDPYKPAEFRGRSLQALIAFPEDARREAGYQIYRLQTGLEPADWKAMASIGSGVREIRIRDPNGVFRVIYVAKFEQAIFVLHCFEKKTQKTSRGDIETAARNYRDLLAEIRP